LGWEGPPNKGIQGPRGNWRFGPNWLGGSTALPIWAPRREYWGTLKVSINGN